MSSHIERHAPPTRRISIPRLMTWLFVVISAGIMVIFVLQIGSFNALAPPSPQRQEADKGSQQKPEEIVVSDTRFTGFDKQQQPYTVTARTAVQDENDSKKVHLAGVSAQVRRQNGEAVDVKSDKAIYDAASKMIDLNGGVEITTKNGLKATMATARINIRSQDLKTDVPVTVIQGGSTIAANGLEISDDGKRILFFNGVKAYFRGSQQGISAQ